MKLGKLLITLRRRCPSCGSRRIWKDKPFSYTCNICRRDFSGGRVLFWPFWTGAIRFAWRPPVKWSPWQRLDPGAVPVEIAETNGHPGEG